MKYYDFTLILEKPSENRWILRVESENQGESGKIELDIPAAEKIAEINRRLEQRETDRDYLKSVGLDLFGRLMIEKARDMFHLSLGEVRNDSTRGLRLRFRALEPEIAVLPWELLYSDMDEAFVGTRVKTPIVRYVDMPMPRAKLAAPYPIKVLVVIPQGDDTTAVIDTDAERKVIDQAISRFKDKVRVTYLADRFDDKRVTWLRLVEHLAEDNYHCLHYIGHGSFHNDRGCILLDAEAGGAEFVDETTFAEGLTNAEGLKLVLLNACNTASQSGSKPLAGVAAQLVRAGIPAVLAMQFSILDAAAVVFARVFYHSLFVGSNRGRVDVAAARGRQALGAKFSGQRELAAPVLFTHAKTNLLLVPEGEGVLTNVPLTGDRLDVLEEARDKTSIPEEKARYAKQIKIGRGAIRAAILIGIIAFLMSTVRLLDVFGIDTRVELTLMSAGYGVREHRVSEELRVVTIDGGGLSTNELRERVGRSIELLNALEAKTIALDLFYSASNGGFKMEPESGQRLANTISESAAPVVVGAVAISGRQLETPDEMRRAASGIGFACYEFRRGFARSLPISARVGDVVYPSFALAAVAAHRNATVFGGFEDDNIEPYLVFADEPSHHFVVSEFKRTRSAANECSAIGKGSEVAHRFIARMPDEVLSPNTSTLSDLESAAGPNTFAGKLVLVGVTGVSDILRDLTGSRDGVFWQADAVNNLMLDEVIKPVDDLDQLMLMLAVVLTTMTIALKMREKRVVLWGAIIVLWIILLVTTFLLYARFGLLLNPVYFILATIAAWWLAKRFGQRWVLQ